MAPTYPGRYAAQSDRSFVVFLSGMRVDKIVALGSWPPVTAALPAMIAELKPDPSLGLLHAQFFVYWRGRGVLQYSRSFEPFPRYAHARNAAHLPAWAEFNHSNDGNGSVGVWQETRTAAPGQYESIFDNMPRLGVGGTAQHLPATGRLDTARGRMGRSKPAEDPMEQP